MCYPSDDKIASYENKTVNSAIVFEANARAAKRGEFATGKGTTARILALLGTGDDSALSAQQIGEALGLPARQLNKRLREQEARGTVYVVDVTPRLTYAKAAA